MADDRFIVNALLTWFAENARDLPWRRTTDPYAIWISEVMLQQTQVQTVIPFWERWMAAAPDVAALARMRFEQVLKLWEGLGYYTRAKNLHRAAQIIVHEHDGSFPDTYNAVLALPGIGRYTAGAICSIAFDQPTPILDGNVARVLTRFYGVRSNVRSCRTKVRLWSQAEQLVRCAGSWAAGPARRCGLFNQSLMELGATVCTPAGPDCTICPIRRRCVARRLGCADRLPIMGQRPPTTRRHFVAFVISRGKQVFVHQPPEGVVNSNLWEFPSVEVTDPGQSIEQLATKALGIRLATLRLLCTVRHSVTRYRIRLDAYRGIGAKADGVRFLAGRWSTLQELDALAFSSAHRRILKTLNDDSCTRDRRTRNPPPPAPARVRKSWSRSG